MPQSFYKLNQLNSTCIALNCRQSKFYDQSLQLLLWHSYTNFFITWIIPWIEEFRCIEGSKTYYFSIKLSIHACTYMKSNRNQTRWRKMKTLLSSHHRYVIVVFLMNTMDNLGMGLMQDGWQIWTKGCGHFPIDVWGLYKYLIQFQSGIMVMVNGHIGLPLPSNNVNCWA
jgi:hypothetical protein